jgi:bifunctional non-homologous end joining protein LigD
MGSNPIALTNKVHKRGDTIKVYSRNGRDWTNKLPSIVDAARGLMPDMAVIDGQIIVQGERGLPDFQALRAASGGVPSERILFYAFDLLHLDGGLRP